MPTEAAAAAAEAAAAASLRYLSDAKPGIRRRAAGGGFSYVAPNGTAVTDEKTLARIRSLAIPPAWTDVWICPAANGHLQATGRDAKGRKQHRYHPRWRVVRDENKYGRLARFARALPRIRRRVARDLASGEMTREHVLAIVVRLLQTTYIRVGNEEYAKANGSFGLTTLTDDHVRIRGARIRFNFRGKSGKDHDITLEDRRLAALVRKSRDLPGEELFQYLDDAGESHPIDSADVNAYIRKVAEDEFTAKDFRTWAGTVLASRALTLAARETDGAPLTKAAVTAAVKAVASQLGNTPAVCRKCYIHPAVLSMFDDPEELAAWNSAKGSAARIAGLSAEESALVHYLEQRAPD